MLKNNMTEAFLTIIILALIGVFMWYIKKQEATVSKLINAVLSKSGDEYVNRTLADNTQIKPEINGHHNPDLVAMDQLSDEQFDAHIAAQLDNEDAVDQEVT